MSTVCQHYVGMYSLVVAGATHHDHIGIVAASCITAVVVSSVALFIFFRLHRAWAASPAMAFACALIMAAAVCAVHYMSVYISYQKSL